MGTELLFAIRSAEGATLNDMEATVGTYQLRSYGGEQSRSDCYAAFTRLSRLSLIIGLIHFSIKIYLRFGDKYYFEQLLHIIVVNYRIEFILSVHKPSQSPNHEFIILLPISTDIITQ